MITSMKSLVIAKKQEVEVIQEQEMEAILSPVLKVEPTDLEGFMK
jgi:hypothetical protein